jgi:predicted extracellular nuclease
MRCDSVRLHTPNPQGIKNIKQKLWQLGLLILGLCSGPLLAQDLIITGVVDGDLPQGLPKAVELHVVNNIADLSVCGLGFANNGGGTDGQEFTFPADGAAAGSLIYASNEATGFTSFFGFTPDYISGSISMNGDDAIELFCNGVVVDVFGDPDVHGDFEAWDYTDGWAYRVGNTGPDGSAFVLSNWSFSGRLGLDGETSNGTATVPFPLGDYIGDGGGENAPIVLNTTPSNGSTGIALDANIAINFSEDVDVTGSWFSIDCAGSGSHSAASFGGPSAYNLDPDSDFDNSELCTVTVAASEVTDVDVDDPPDNMAGDFVFSFTTSTPAVSSPVMINEVDADQTGSDSAEFVELYDGGVGNTSLDGLVVVLFNGSDDASYQAFDLDGESTDANGFFVLCGNPANVPGCDLDVGSSTNLIQNGADAVALLQGDASSFPNDTPLTTDFLIDAVVYDTNDGDDAALLTLLNAGQPQVNEAGQGNSSLDSNQRCPNGTGGSRNTAGYVQAEPTAGRLNECVVPVINEVDADDASTDDEEFIELYTFGAGNFSLDGYSLVFYNGSDDASYLAFDLDGYSTNGDGYFVLCGDAAKVANCDLDVTKNTNLIQNGADAVALVFADAVDYPNDTPVSPVNVVDALVYDTNDSDDAALLVLLNAGQPQVNENGGGNKDFESNQRCQNGTGGERNTDTYEQASPTPGVTNSCAPIEIFAIQGSGSSSPFAGYSLATNENLVTAVGPEGFFIQTPDARDDGFVDTSNGIYVFTGSAPTVAEGDLVNVTGAVTEFFGFTEFAGGSVVSVLSSGHALPAVTVFDSSVPSPDPVVSSCGIEFECYESMLIEITGGTVTAANQRFGSDPIAEVHITAAGERTYREPGIEYPGLSGFPEWDGNPEVFEMDADKLGLAFDYIAAGSNFSATGVLGFEYGGYEFWPTSLDLTPAILPTAVRTRDVAEMTVGALNLFRLYDDIDDPDVDVIDPANSDVVIRTTNETIVDVTEYERRLTKFSAYIRDVLMSPDILAVSEVESQVVLQDLADWINTDDPTINYTAYLEEGNDIGGIDVGFLVLDTVIVDSITQLGRFEILAFDDSLLNDRPPLLLEGRQVADGSDFPIAVMAIHGRSLGGIDDSSKGERVRQKRFEQAQSVAAKVQQLQLANPDVNLVVAGDFNAYEFSDSFADVTGHMKGGFVAADNLVCDTNTCDDLVDPNLINQVLMIPEGERYSFIFQGNAQALDHALTSNGLDELIRGFGYGRGNSDAAVDLINDASTVLRSSDHDGLVLFMIKDSDGDGVTDDLDVCPGTVIPEAAAMVKLGVNRWALTDDDRNFDTTAPNGRSPHVPYDIHATAGCSCEQIVDAQHLGKGHMKFGCSIGAMGNWVDLVSKP